MGSDFSITRNSNNFCQFSIVGRYVMFRQAFIRNLASRFYKKFESVCSSNSFLIYEPVVVFWTDFSWRSHVRTTWYKSKTFLILWILFFWVFMYHYISIRATCVWSTSYFLLLLIYSFTITELSTRCFIISSLWLMMVSNASYPTSCRFWYQFLIKRFLIKKRVDDLCHSL